MAPRRMALPLLLGLLLCAPARGGIPVGLRDDTGQKVGGIGGEADRRAGSGQGESKSPEPRANPYIKPAPPSGASDGILSLPHPCLAGEPCTLTAAVGNDGTLASVANVSFVWQDWGIAFTGWEGVGWEIVSVPMSTASPPKGALATIEKTFQTRKHVCIKASVSPIIGGNKDPTDDTAQLNLEVVYDERSDEENDSGGLNTTTNPAKFLFWIPFHNQQGPPLDIKAKLLCPEISSDCGDTLDGICPDSWPHPPPFPWPGPQPAPPPSPPAWASCEPWLRAGAVQIVLPDDVQAQEGFNSSFDLFVGAGERRYLPVEVLFGLPLESFGLRVEASAVGLESSADIQIVRDTASNLLNALVDSFFDVFLSLFMTTSHPASGACKIDRLIASLVRAIVSMERKPSKVVVISALREFVLLVDEALGAQPEPSATRDPCREEGAGADPCFSLPVCFKPPEPRPSPVCECPWPALSRQQKAFLDWCARVVTDVVRSMACKGGDSDSPFVVEGDIYRFEGMYASAVDSYKKAIRPSTF